MLLAVSHPLFRQAVIEVLANIPQVSLIAKVASGWDAIRLSAELKPDIILLDLNLPGLSGFQVTRLVRKESPAIRVVILLDEEGAEHIKAVAKSGAWGHLAKSQLTQELPSLLDKLMREEKLNDSSNRTIDLRSK